MGRKPVEKPLSPLEESYQLIAPPEDLSEEEQEAWEYFVEVLKNATRYKKKSADVELIQQFVQHKVMRDKAWIEWNKKPERYIRIVTGICADGTTPKIVVKENEHYKILNDCNKYIEKLWKDLKLTPDTRSYC